MFYTEYGTRHVISLLVLLSYLYGHVALRHGFDSVDRKDSRVGTNGSENYANCVRKLG